ncbi:MAG: TRAP transporter small permease subunit [Oscillospiraceae bacterium]|nr:TRAP transporter small permease subunit [Oscillospiraceae bacterium]
MDATAVFNKIDKAKPLFDVVYFIVLQVAKLFLVSTVLIACLMVAGRYIGFIPSFPWTEEVILTFMAYMTLLGAALAVRRSAHIRMVALDPFLNKTAIKVLDLLADVAIIYFSILLLTEGWTYAMTIGGRGFFTSMPTVSLFWRFLPMPLGGLFMIFFSIEVTCNHIKAFFVKDGELK